MMIIVVFFFVFFFLLDVNHKDMESWLSNRDSVPPFDKTTFLSDQPGPHLPFLSCFLEGQMFATFIDSKVLSNFGQCSHSVRVFDDRIKLLRYSSLVSCRLYFANEIVPLYSLIYYYIILMLLSVCWNSWNLTAT